MNTYKVTAPRPVLDIEPGKTGDFDLAEDEELDYLNSGRLEIVPREYVVVGINAVFDTKPGDTLKKALRIGEERALIQGGHIERKAAKKTPQTNTPARVGGKKE